MATKRTFGVASTAVKNNVVALHEKKGEKGATLWGSMWKGGPMLRLCLNKEGEIWLAQIQHEEGPGLSIDVNGKALCDKGQIVALEFDGLTMMVREVNDIEGGGTQAASGKTIPVIEVVFEDDVPVVEIGKMVEKRRRLKMVRKFEIKGGAKKAQRTNYDYPAGVVQGGEKPPQNNDDNTSVADNSDNIPF